MSHDGKGTIRPRLTESSLGGIYRIPDMMDELMQIRENGLDEGSPSGWAGMDNYYRVKRGMMSIVTGIPSSGKSEFIDAVLVNLANKEGWKFAIFSPENYPLSLHVIKIAEKYIGKQFKNPLFTSLCMDKIEIADAVDFIGEHFTWIYPDDEKEKINLDTILAKAAIIQQQTGLDGLLIDPWNELEHDRNGRSETDHISESLTKLRRFARKHNVHTWLVAHPQKMIKKIDGTYDPPTPYDISGSAHWRNKADFCICVHRGNIAVNEVDVYIQKVKFKHLGKVGKVHFNYEWYSGRFEENNGNL